MLRVWSEYLDLSVARSEGTLRLLERGALHPLFAVRPETDRQELAETLKAVRSRGLEAGVWPLLSTGEGYWPSVRNAEQFVAYLDDLLDDLERRGASVDWVAFDLEPPLSGGDTIASNVWRALRRAVGNLSRLEAEVGGSEGVRSSPVGQFREAMEVYDEAIVRLRRKGVGTLAVTTPPAVADLGGELVWQTALELPWSPLDWERAGFMAYGSLIAGHSGGMLDFRDVRAIHYGFMVRTHRAFGHRSHVSVGLTGTGVYGDEPVYESADELAADVSAARAAGIDDIAVFCLEGLLGKERPGEWVDALRGAPARPPPSTWRAEVVSRLVSCATGLISTLHARGRD